MSVTDFENARWNGKRQKLEFRHAAALGLVGQGPVLDVGCGDGLFLNMLKETGIAAEGVDISAVAVGHCRAAGLAARQCDFASQPLPFGDGHFAAVVALDVLEHLYDPANLLMELKRVSSGTVIISVPNFSSLPARLQTFLGRVPENNRPHKGHIYWFNWPVLRSLLAKNRLRVVELRVNAPWGLVPLARLWPNLFALSFVITCTKSE